MEASSVPGLNMASLSDRISLRSACGGAPAELSPRESEVLGLIVEGRRNREIAQSLGISIKTVEFHRAHIMRKTGAASAVELVRRAFAGEREAQTC